MSLRLPDRLNGEDRAERHVSSVLGEIAQEKAATAARMSERVEASLAALRAASTDCAKLIDIAANALWELVVQREAAGFDLDLRALIEEYDVPREVMARFGHHPTR